MNLTGEKFYSKAATRRRMNNITRARYEQLVESGMLEKPVKLTPSARAVHTESQIVLALEKIYQDSCAGYLQRQRENEQKGYKPMKPISQKIKNGILLHQQLGGVTRC